MMYDSKKQEYRKPEVTELSSSSVTNGMLTFMDMMMGMLPKSGVTMEGMVGMEEVGPS